MTIPKKPTVKRRKPKKKSAHQILLAANRHRYEDLLAAQGGGCALCGRLPSIKKKLDLDHDHNTMQIRGLLCFRCNRALPYWMDSQWLLRAATYVAKTEASQ